MRTHPLQYQLKPRVNSIASLLLFFGLTSCAAPDSNTLSTSSRETRATNSHAPGQLSGVRGSKGRSGMICSLHVVRVSPVRKSVLNRVYPMNGTSITNLEPAPVADGCIC